METLRDNLSASQWPDAQDEPEGRYEREMGALQELLAANNIEAAQEKLDAIIRAAEADGHIDEDNERQINDARSKLETIRQQRVESENATEEVRVRERMSAYCVKGAMLWAASSRLLPMCSAGWTRRRFETKGGGGDSSAQGAFCKRAGKATKKGGQEDSEGCTKLDSSGKARAERG